VVKFVGLENMLKRRLRSPFCNVCASSSRKAFSERKRASRMYEFAIRVSRREKLREKQKRRSCLTRQCVNVPRRVKVLLCYFKSTGLSIIYDYTRGRIAGTRSVNFRQVEFRLGIGIALIWSPTWPLSARVSSSRNRESHFTATRNSSTDAHIL